MNKGFSLIEIIISCAVISSFFASFFLFLTSDIKNINKLNLKYAHILDAEAGLEAAKRIPFSELKSGGSMLVTDLDPNTKCIELKKNGITLHAVRSKY